MAPKPPNTRVTFVRTVKPSADPKVRKRKKSKNSEDPTSGKRARRNSPEDKLVRMMKGKNGCPLQAEVIEHIESCISTAVLSVLSRKKVLSYEAVQKHLTQLRQRLLHFCKDMRFPATKLGKLKNLQRDIQEEERKREEYEDIMAALDREIEEAVETANKIEETAQDLEDKMESLKEQAPERSLDPLSSHTDLLPLPPSTFQAPTMQDRIRKLQNPELLLKELSEVQGDPVYKNLQTLLPMCYTEVSTL